MKKTTFAIALAFASLGAAHAQNLSPAPQEKQMRFLVGAGFTYGGDRLGTVSYVNGGLVSIHAGTGPALTTGIDYRVTPKFSFQGTIGYHLDNASGSNGSIRFERVPLELLAYYHLGQHWRLGGGARYVSNVKLKSSGAAYIGNFDFDNTLSAELEAEYLMSPHVGFTVRLVDEDFKQSAPNGVHVKANHIGLFAHYYF